MSEQLPEPTYREAPARAPQPTRRSTGRKVARAIGLGVLSVVGFVVLALVAAVIWLHTGGGARELAHFAANETRQAIAGDLKMREIRVGGLLNLHVCLDGVQLSDPEGHKVLSADSVCVRLSTLPLRAHKIALDQLELTRPWIEMATVQGPDGKPTTTFARAIEARKKSPKEAAQSGPFAWTIDVGDLRLHGGAFALRPGPGEPATFALEELELGNAHATYAATAAEAALQLTAQLTAPGRTPVALQLDAGLEGAAASGNLTLRQLSVKLGQSSLSASGSWDLAKQAGELKLPQIVLEPGAVDAITPNREGPRPLTGVVRGEAELKSDGRTASLDLKLQAGGGTIAAKATATLEKEPLWDLQLKIDNLDPGAASGLAPRGQFSARAALHGKGTPKISAEGVEGDLRGVVHVGPAKLERVGSLTADLDARISGRYALIKAFSATALGLQIKARGAAAREELSLDVDIQAPSLAEVGRAVGALQRKKSLPMAGALSLKARLTGSTKDPDAQLHVRAPKLRWGPTVSADGLAVDGELHGLGEPDGALKISAQRVDVGSIDLGSLRVDMGLEFPVAHLRIDAGVRGGNLLLAGDARVDEDKDGLILSHFTLAYPGNELHLARDTNVHFRDEVIVEPLELTGPHGGLRFSAQLWPKTPQAPARMDAAVVVTRFELDKLPEFALPKDLGLHGVLDANAVAKGPQAGPDLDLQASVKGAGAHAAGDLLIDAQTHLHLHAGRLQAKGDVSAEKLLHFTFQGDLPAVALAEQPLTEPVSLDAVLSDVDLAKLADAIHLSQLQKARLHGRVGARIVATGTLGQPRATLSIVAHDLGNDKISQIDARAGLLLEKGKAALDGAFSLAGDPALGFTGEAPFELVRALRERGYVKGLVDRPVKVDVAVTALQLARLSKAGLLPPESEGAVTLSLKLTGTPNQPSLALDAAGTNVSVGRLRGLGFETKLGITDKVQLELSAQAQGAPVAKLDAGVKLSGEELLQVARNKDAPEAIAPLLDRAVSMTLEIPGLPIARASELAGKPAVAEGQVAGRVTLAGTPARPRLLGRLLLKDLTSGQHKLGGADLYLEAEESGALVHLGIDPPGGGHFLGHAQLQAGLGARALLRDGVSSILDGKLSGEVQAKKLDLAFLSGLAPTVRRAAGVLDADVKVQGVLAKPIADGDAHLHGALFDVVGQGVYEDVGLDAKFSPKEIVIDRLTGSTGPGTFSAVLVASRKASGDADTPDKLEFSGEIHLGDGESVRDRKDAKGQALHAGAVPVRQAGEDRASVAGELDLFGDYADGELTVNAKIPETTVVIKQLPDKKLPGLKPNPDVMLIHPGEKPHPPGIEPEEAEEETRARAEANFRVHAQLALQHLYVKAADFEFPVESDMTFDWDASHPDEPTADGSIHVPTGSFSALGRRFAIEDAKIIETGGDIADPELEIKARYDNPQAVVTITIAGTAQDPQIDMTSNPPMDQDAIAFFLATGRIQGRATQSGGGVDLSGAASSVLGGILFGQLRKELADVLPVDVLTIETGSQGVSEASVGKYIGDRIFIGYRQRLTPAPAENTTEARIEYEMNRSVSAEATIGDKTRDVSVLWTHDF